MDYVFAGVKRNRPDLPSSDDEEVIRRNKMPTKRPRLLSSDDESDEEQDAEVDDLDDEDDSGDENI